MKKISFLLLFITGLLMSVNAQKQNLSNQIVCDFGITFEISGNPSWGYGEPVILTVQPFSPADKAGLKVGDIIMEVNNTATYLRTYQNISSWLSDSATPEIRLTIRNISTYFSEYIIYRECKRASSLSEFDLASAYSFYSLRDTNQRGFALPLKVDPNQNVDFTDYRTFDFVQEDGNPSNLDKHINFELEKTLKARGLKRTSNDPDMLVQVYYTYQPNVKYDTNTHSANVETWRFDTQTEEMVAVPILSAEDPNADNKGQFIVELGVRFFDKKFIDKTKLTQIWDAKTRDFLTDQMSIEDYSSMHLPLMLLQYPYSNPKTIAKYVVSFKKFNYTGLNFAGSDLKTITYVDENSPASQAGLRQGDVVQKINEMKFDSTPEQLEIGYKRFLIETMSLRDKKTRFIDANGFPNCMYWSPSKYSQVLEAFKKQNIYSPSFSYLYSFEKYIPGESASGNISVEVKSNDGDSRTVSVRPEIQKSTVVRAL